FPQLYMAKKTTLEARDFLEVIKSSYAKREDLKLTPIKLRQIKRFQQLYLELVHIISKKNKSSAENVLLEIMMRSSVINKYDRVTGNSISFVVDKISKARPKLTAEETFEVSQNFKRYQTLDPDKVVESAIISHKQKNLLTR